jgi:cobalt-zinc-cadmium efflux system membrane fusion protein
MTRAFLFWFAVVVASSAAGACRSEKQAAGHAEVPAATPAGVHATPHREDDLHVAVDTRRDLRITTAVVSAEATAEQVTEIPGEIRVDERAYAEVGSPVSGRITAIHVQPGDNARAGDALVTLRSTEVGRARAEHAAALARRTLARQAADRIRVLVGERIAPQRELQQADADLAAAESGVDAAATGLAALGVGPTVPGGQDVSSLVLRAPIAGVVLDREALLGQAVDPANTLVRIAGLDRVWLVVQAFERDAVRVRRGTTARVVFPAFPGQARTGRVTWIGQRVSPDAHTMPVRIELPNTDRALRPGMTASAQVPLANTLGRVLSVPAPALQRLADAWVVFIPRGDDEWHFEVRTVGRGRDLGAAVEILSGLAVGDRVVVDGSFVLKAEAEKARGGAVAAHTH